MDLLVKVDQLDYINVLPVPEATRPHQRSPLRCFKAVLFLVWTPT